MLENDIYRNDSVYDPYEFTDEVSASITYVGLSGQALTAAPQWRIKKVEKTGNITTVKYPDGEQTFTFVWNLRATYTYK